MQADLAQAGVALGVTPGTLKPTVRNPLMTLLLPTILVVGGIILSIVCGRRRRSAEFGGASASRAARSPGIAELAGCFFFFISAVKMMGELKAVTKAETLAWWGLLIPFYSLYVILVVIPGEMTKAKQWLRVQEPTRNVLLYWLIFLVRVRGRSQRSGASHAAILMGGREPVHPTRRGLGSAAASHLLADHLARHCAAAHEKLLGFLLEHRMDFPAPTNIPRSCGFTSTSLLAPATAPFMSPAPAYAKARARHIWTRISEYSGLFGVEELEQLDGLLAVAGSTPGLARDRGEHRARLGVLLLAELQLVDRAPAPPGSRRAEDGSWPGCNEPGRRRARAACSRSTDSRVASALRGSSWISSWARAMDRLDVAFLEVRLEPLQRVFATLLGL